MSSQLREDWDFHEFQSYDNPRKAQNIWNEYEHDFLEGGFQSPDRELIFTVMNCDDLELSLERVLTSLRGSWKYASGIELPQEENTFIDYTSPSREASNIIDSFSSNYSKSRARRHAKVNTRSENIY
ncbi:hypothetical protein KW805_04955 [Candidatus Pacearchaeota archaeon]|nr:hypothetical protein [Candidatus Pacearchaeota archaeon]